MTAAAPWLVPGAEVVCIYGRNNTPSPVLTIERVLKRDVVLTNGDRWSLTRLTPNGEHIIKHTGGAWDPSSALFPADAPQVATARRDETRRCVAGQCRTIASKIEDAIRREDWDEARRLAARLSHWLTNAPDWPAEVSQ